VLLRCTFLYTWWTSFGQTVPNRCYLTFFHSRTFNCTSKTTGWFTKGLKLIPPHANKVLLKVARVLIYIDGLLSVANCIGRCYLTFFHFPSSLDKTTGWFTKGWNWSTCHANKVLLQGAHAFLYTLMDFFQSHQTVPKLLSYLLPFSRTFNCTSKTTGWFTKGLKLILLTLTKCYSR
jgi:hypothetical protein